MGVFSWHTNDTDRSIPNRYSPRDTFTVHMIDDKGNRYTEERYEGYGVFGGKDYYELLAEMNYPEAKELDTDPAKLRTMGIDLEYQYADDDNVKWPNLVEDPNRGWQNEQPKSCAAQGFLYIKQMPVCNECASGVLSVFTHAQWNTELDRWTIDEVKDDDLVFCQECGIFREFKYIEVNDD